MKSMEPHRNIIKNRLNGAGVPVDVSRPVNIAYKHINSMYIYNAEIYCHVTYVYRT